MPFPTPLARRTYRVWSDDQKEQILDEARRLQVIHPDYSLRKLLQQAQLVLAEDLQRKIGDINTPAYKWFHDGLVEETPIQSTSLVPSKPQPTPPTAPSPPTRPCQCKPAFNEFLGDVSIVEVLRTVIEALGENAMAIKRLDQRFTEHQTLLNDVAIKIPAMPLQQRVPSLKVEDIQHDVRQQGVVLNELWDLTRELKDDLKSLQYRSRVG